MIQKFDKSIVKAYKFMLIDKLNKPEEWGIHSTRRRDKKSNEAEFSHYNSKTYMSFIVKFNNTVEIRINSDVVYVFTKLANLDLITKIIYFRKMKKHEEINNETKLMEKRMKDALPDDYKRAVKISKIKSKI